jgi:hypothetical protein
MLSPEELRVIPNQNFERRYIDSPLKGDLKHLHREHHRDTGTAVIEAMRTAFSDAQISYTYQEMLDSITTSLQLTPDKLAAIIPNIKDRNRIERNFLGLVYVGSKHTQKEGFAEAMKLEFINLGGSNFDVLANPERGIEEIAGRYHRVFDSELPLR